MAYRTILRPPAYDCGIYNLEWFSFLVLELPFPKLTPRAPFSTPGNHNTEIEEFLGKKQASLQQVKIVCGVRLRDRVWGEIPQQTRVQFCSFTTAERLDYQW
jgi:hypothetical protein